MNELASRALFSVLFRCAPTMSDISVFGSWVSDFAVRYRLTEKSILDLIPATAFQFSLLNQLGTIVGGISNVSGSGCSGTPYSGGGRDSCLFSGHPENHCVFRETLLDKFDVGRQN